MTANPLRDLAQQVHDLDRRVRAKSSTGQLAHSSIEDGAIQAYDRAGSQTMAIGKQWDGTYAPTVIGGQRPSAPSAPIGSDGTGSFTVAWDGHFVDSLVVPMDFLRVDVHYAASPSFDPDNSNRAGSITAATGGQLTVGVAAGPYYAKLVCWTLGGKFSDPSEAVLVQSTVPTGGAASDGIPPASSPAASALSGIKAIYVSWDPITNADLVTYEIHLSATTGFTPDSTTKAGEVAGTSFQVTKLPDGSPLPFATTYYIKIIARDADGAAAPGTQASGNAVQIPAGYLADGSVDTAAIAPDAITAAQLADGSVLATSLGAGAVEAAAIAAGAVGSAAIASGAVGSTQLGTNAVGATQLADNAVDTAAIATGAVSTDRIATGAVTANELAANSVIAGKILAGSITTAKVAAGAITTNEIAAGTIAAVNIAALTITAAEIAANAVTASKIAANVITAAKIAAGTITATEIASGTITATQIAANTITAAKIAAGTITAAEIATGAITAAKLDAAAITGKTITGGLFRTAATGRRLEIDSVGDTGELSFFSGYASETAPASIQVDSNPSTGYLNIAAPGTAAVPTPPSILMASSATLAQATLNIYSPQTLLLAADSGIVNEAQQVYYWDWPMHTGGPWWFGYLSSTQTQPAASTLTTSSQWTEIESDAQNGVTVTAGGLFIVHEPGLYRLGGQFWWAAAAGATGDRLTQVVRTSPTATTIVSVTVDAKASGAPALAQWSKLFRFAAGDEFVVRYQWTGNNGTGVGKNGSPTGSTQDISYFQIGRERV